MNNKSKVFLGVLIYIAIFTLVFIQLGCSHDFCDCEHVVYENDVEVSREYWDETCLPVVLDKTIYAYQDGTEIFTVTKIECR